MSEFGPLRDQIAALQRELAELRRRLDQQIVLAGGGNAPRPQILGGQLTSDLDAGEGETATFRLFDHDGESLVLQETEYEGMSLLRSISGINGDRCYVIKRPWGWEFLQTECQRDEEEEE